MGQTHRTLLTGEKNSTVVFFDSGCPPRLDGERPRTQTWLEANRHPYLVVASKIDKLNQSEQQHGLKAISQHAEPLPFSAVTGRGVREIWQAITKTHQPKSHQ
jgi:GTP-binding protein EngB required for normal cell division